MCSKGRIHKEGEIIMHKAIGSQTMSLFSIPGFLSGAARTLDLGATMDLYNESADGSSADCNALLFDWRQVGMEISSAMERYESG